MIIKGFIKKGLGAASSTIPLDEIVKQFPEIVGCYKGTINVALERPLFIAQEDFTTPPLDWYPHQPNQRFGFVRVRFRPSLTPSHQWENGWIIRPEFSPHLCNPLLVEILTKKQEFKIGDSCELSLENNCYEMPVVVVGKLP